MPTTREVGADTAFVEPGQVGGAHDNTERVAAVDRTDAVGGPGCPGDRHAGPAASVTALPLVGERGRPARPGALACRELLTHLRGARDDGRRGARRRRQRRDDVRRLRCRGGRSIRIRCGHDHTESVIDITRGGGVRLRRRAGDQVAVGSRAVALLPRVGEASGRPRPTAVARGQRTSLLGPARDCRRRARLRCGFRARLCPRRRDRGDGERRREQQKHRAHAAASRWHFSSRLPSFVGYPHVVPSSRRAMRGIYSPITGRFSIAADNASQCEWLWPPDRHSCRHRREPPVELGPWLAQPARIAWLHRCRHPPSRQLTQPP